MSDNKDQPVLALPEPTIIEELKAAYQRLVESLEEAELCQSN